MNTTPNHDQLRNAIDTAHAHMKEFIFVVRNGEYPPKQRRIAETWAEQFEQSEREALSLVALTTCLAALRVLHVSSYAFAKMEEEGGAVTPFGIRMIDRGGALCVAQARKTLEALTILLHRDGGVEAVQREACAEAQALGEIAAFLLSE